MLYETQHIYSEALQLIVANSKAAWARGDKPRQDAELEWLFRLLDYARKHGLIADTRGSGSFGFRPDGMSPYWVTPEQRYLANRHQRRRGIGYDHWQGRYFHTSQPGSSDDGSYEDDIPAWNSPYYRIDSEISPDSIPSDCEPVATCSICQWRIGTHVQHVWGGDLWLCDDDRCLAEVAGKSEYACPACHDFGCRLCMAAEELNQ